MIRSGVGALAAAVVLTACVGGSDPKPSPTKTAASKLVTPKAGDCFADADSKLADADPDFTSKVKCTKPHLYEVTGTSPIPDRYLEGSQSTLRDRLLGDDGPLVASFWRYATAACSSHVWDAMGVEADGIRSGRLRLSEIGGMPAASGVTYQYVLTPDPGWSDGERELICFAQFTDPDDEGVPTAVTSYNLKPVVDKYLGRHFPSERRRCDVRAGRDEIDAESCTRAHDSEVIFSFDARFAFGVRFVKEVITSGLTDDANDRMMKVCDDVLPQLLGRRINPALDSWFWYGHDAGGGWIYPTEAADVAQHYIVECQLRPTDTRLVLAPGTVVDRPDYPELEDRSYRSDA